MQIEKPKLGKFQYKNWTELNSIDNTLAAQIAE